MHSVEYLRERLNYDATSGALTWRTLGKMANKRFCAGSPAGYFTGAKRDRLVIEVEGRRYQGHRVAWALHYGAWPARWVDHIDGDSKNNRISNLRLATPGENARNRGAGKNSTSGLKGVFWFPESQKWRARIMVDRKSHHLGLFNTKEEARDAYNEAAARLHGEFARAA